MNHLPQIEQSDSSLSEALNRELALSAKLQSLAVEHGLSWLFDTRAEAIREQRAVALAGYLATYDTLASLGNKHLGLTGKSRYPREQAASPEQFDQLLDAQLTTWATPDAQTGKSALDYLVAAQEQQPGLGFTLVATPNVLAEAKDVMALATAFGKDQPKKTWILDNDYSGQPKFYRAYTPEQLSGTPAPGDVPVRFSLMPTQPTPELGVQAVGGQLAALAVLQQTHPEAKLHVPSVLANITRWHTLRAQDTSTKELLTDDIFNQTLVRHFNLEPKDVDGRPRVPDSYVHLDGGPRLNSSDAGNDDSAVVAVG